MKLVPTIPTISTTPKLASMRVNKGKLDISIALSPIIAAHIDIPPHSPRSDYAYLALLLMSKLYKMKMREIYAILAPKLDLNTDTVAKKCSSRRRKTKQSLQFTSPELVVIADFLANYGIHIEGGLCLSQNEGKNEPIPNNIKQKKTKKNHANRVNNRPRQTS